ncbi:MAG TPA: transposase, partial [Spirillospora sp.]|nr:transposase [Spirillospora sp.]
MKIVVQVKLIPDATQTVALERTLHTVNQCANQVSAASFTAYGLRGSVKDLRSMAYGDLKAR